MKKVGMVVVGLALGLSLGGMVAQASRDAGSPPGMEAALSSRYYNLGSLRLLERVRFLVEDRYVDPSRIQPAEMFEAALDRVEWETPEVLFRYSRGDSLLHISIDQFSTTIELPEIDRLNVMATQLSRIAGILDDHLDESVDRPGVEYALINGMLSTLDPHTILLPPEQSREMEVENQGEFGGLGITIGIRDGVLAVQYPLRETPAYRAGIEAGDRILRIDDESTVNMSLEEAVGRLRGLVGEPVTITVDRDGFDEPKDFTIVRATIRMNPVEGMLLEGGIGYIQIDNFHASTASDLANLLTTFKRENQGRIEGLVLDLRGNPGGYLHQAIEVSDFFISEGVLVSTVEEGHRDVRRAAQKGTEPDYPMVVLVNAHSASASEIVAGALKNHQRAVIVGERTFGKGSVQNLYPNGDESRLKLTIAKYLTPGDQSIQSIGIPPDVLLQPSLVEERESDDGESVPLVSLFWRDRVEREADLDKALDGSFPASREPAYALRYLSESNSERRTSDDLDVSDDWEVNFARDLILAAPSSRPAEMLQAAEAVVERHAEAEAQRVEEAFGEQEINWSVGDQPEDVNLVGAVNMGERGAIISGLERQYVELRLTNSGDEAVHQVLAVSSSTLGWLDGDEFYFGKLEPGETRSWRRELRNIEGQTDQIGEISFDLMDAEGRDLGSHSELVRVVSSGLPDFSWSGRIVDDGEAGSSGDGDGIPEQGETVVLRLTIENNGEGAAEEAFVKLRNQAGMALDLQVGTVELGELEQGASGEVDLRFELRGDEAMPVELTVGDNARFDYNAVMRGGFYSFFSQVVEFEIVPGQPLDDGRLSPPAVEVSRSPELTVDNGSAVLSGVVRDDAGVRDLFIYHGDDKVFYQGGGEGVLSLPFTTELELEEGDNLVVVLARDDQGLTDIRSVNVFYQP